MLVNNAGANFPDGRDEWDPDGFSAALDLNVEGAMRLTMGLRPALAASTMAGGASVVNLVSMTAFRSTTIVPGLLRRQGGPAHPDPEPGGPLGRPTASG